ncbi:MAG: MarR family transcriptional regulator [Chloroflexia bacterium]|nr:MarR family transcriptional regulator [Chloroflexia bacterium]
MGTWGTAIFDDDVAMDARGTFDDALVEGLSVPAATQRVREEYAEILDDPDEGPVVRLALAGLQLEQGALQPGAQREALAVIDQGQGLDRWEEAGEESLAERKQVLEAFKARLRSAPVSPGD